MSGGLAPTARVQYRCNCLTGTAHTHETTCHRAWLRGGHVWSSDDIPVRDERVPNGFYAASVCDAVEGALLGLLIGDALGSTLHWYYTYPVAIQHLTDHYGGRLTGYTAVADAVKDAHPDSWKYFRRVNLAAQPIDLVHGRAAQYAVEGTHYHRDLPAGDNTLTARLTTLAMHHLAANGRLNAREWFNDYARFMTTPGGHNNDTWVDETHRVLWRNLAATTAQPHEAGMDDCCLSGLELATPALLAYLGRRPHGMLAVRSQLQYTHKSEDMAFQAGMWGDALRLLMHAALGEGHRNATASAPHPPQAVGGGVVDTPRTIAAVKAAVDAVLLPSPAPAERLRTMAASASSVAAALPASASDAETVASAGDRAADHGGATLLRAVAQVDVSPVISPPPPAAASSVSAVSPPAANSAAASIPDAKAAATAPFVPPPSFQHAVPIMLRAMARSFSNGRMDPANVEATGVTDEDAFHGHRPVFSVR